MALLTRSYKFQSPEMVLDSSPTADTLRRTALLTSPSRQLPIEGCRPANGPTGPGILRDDKVVPAFDPVGFPS
jgi:hypothetical protein